MNVIKPANNIIINKWNLQYYNRDRAYNMIKYRKHISIPEDDVVVMENMITREIICLSSKEFEVINSPDFNKKHPILHQYLVSRWWMIPFSMNEYSMVYTFKNSMKPSKLISDYFDSYVILPTTNCNANCSYCYEAGLEAKDMSEKTAKDVVEFMYKRHKRNTNIHIHWFGGEPTCNMDAINTICLGLDEKNIKFTSSMMSNGYLFTEEYASIARRIWNLETIQITLDGTAEVYNRIKRFRIPDDNNPFDRVINNIKYLLDAGVRVVIRLNMSNDNIQSLYDVVDFIDDTFSDIPDRENKLSMFAIPLFEGTSIGYVSRTSEERKAIYEESFKLEKYIEANNLLTDQLRYFDRYPYTMQCIADNPNGVLISPEGKLGKCEHHLNDEDFFSDIYGHKMSNLKEVDKYRQPIDEYLHCEECFYYPVCNKLKLCPNESRCDIWVRKERADMVDRSLHKIYKEFKKRDSL